mmetsp:Transcript_2941/g.6893  ORF Transcript_2941/g.6893 Transcript_2941/m.6893 type:complete len:201 (-) Transcript_2941:147-749(-)
MPESAFNLQPELKQGDGHGCSPGQSPQPSTRMGSNVTIYDPPQFKLPLRCLVLSSGAPRCSAKNPPHSVVSHSSTWMQLEKVDRGNHCSALLSSLTSCNCCSLVALISVPPRFQASVLASDFPLVLTLSALFAPFFSPASLVILISDPGARITLWSMLSLNTGSTAYSAFNPLVTPSNTLPGCVIQTDANAADPNASVLR